MKFRMTSLLALLLAGGSLVSFGQGYDDDDIYFNPSKAKQQPKKQVPQSTGYTVYDYPAADTYLPDAGNTSIDVDTYNRRGIFAPADTNSKSQELTDFNCTRKIERFHNPDIIVMSDDADAVNLYYSQPANVNIIVQADPFDFWGYPYYGSSWYWGYPRSWFSWNWGWGPSWSWGGYWGPSWSWSWGPAWAWGPSWGWGGGYWPSWGWTAPSRPNRPVGNYRPGYGSGRPSGNYRPGNNGYRPGYSTSGTGSYRPGSNSSGYRPGNNPSGYRQSTRPSNRNNNSGYRSGSRSSNNNNYNYSRPGNNNSGSFGGYRGGSSGGSFGAGRSGGGTGRGRH